VAARERVTFNQHQVVLDPDIGWRCSCPMWEADGRGCIHTAQVAAVDSLSEQAEKLGRARTAPPPRRDWILMLQGPIASLAEARGLVDFELGSRWLTLVSARLGRAGPLHEGQYIEVVARDRPTDGYHDVLAIRLPEEGIARYTGFLPHRGVGVCTVFAGLAELSHVMWLMVPAGILLVSGLLVYALCWRQRMQVMRRLRSKGELSPPVAKQGRAA
jgi:hypothetical protein